MPAILRFSIVAFLGVSSGFASREFSPSTTLHRERERRLTAAEYFEAGEEKCAHGDMAGAVKDFTLALALKRVPERETVYFERGKARRKLHDLDGAIADFTEAIRLVPRDPFPYNDRGNAHRDKGELDEAMADYDKAIELDPKYDYAYNGRGNTHVDKGEYDAAIADYDRALKINPRYVYPYNGRGNARKGKGDLDGALADYNKAIELDPRYSYPYLGRGNVRQRKGDLDGALADYNRGIELDPRHGWGYFERGGLRALRGEWAKAEADFDAADWFDAKYFHYAIWRSVAQRWLGKEAEANAGLRKALDGRAETTRGDWSSRIAEFFLGGIDEAGLLRAAEELPPGGAHGRKCEGWFYAGMAHLLAGRKTEAAGCFRQCLETGDRDFFEYSLAEAELARLGKE